MKSKRKAKDTQPRKPRRAEKPVTYNVDNKHTFIVSPIYKNYSGEKIDNLLLNLIKRDVEKY